MNRFSEQKFLVIGLPMKITPNQEIRLAMSKKIQNSGRNSQETARFPFPFFAGRGRVISERLANRLEVDRLNTTRKLEVV